MIQSALRGGRSSDLSKKGSELALKSLEKNIGLIHQKGEISPLMHGWGKFGVIGGARVHIEASTELGPKSLLQVLSTVRRTGIYFRSMSA